MIALYCAFGLFAYMVVGHLYVAWFDKVAPGHPATKVWDHGVIVLTWPIWLVAEAVLNVCSKFYHLSKVVAAFIYWGVRRGN